MSEPTIRQSARRAATKGESSMDAPLRLATSEGERWAYVADKLNEAAERNERTAAILERLSVRLDGHDERIERLERREEAATEREIERVAVDDAAHDVGAMPTSVAAVFNRIYSDWRIVLIIGGVLGGVLGHLGIGITWH